MLFRTRSFITSQNTSKTIKSSHSFARTLLAQLGTLGGTGENVEIIRWKICIRRFFTPVPYVQRIELFQSRESPHFLRSQSFHHIFYYQK